TRHNRSTSRHHHRKNKRFLIPHEQHTPTPPPLEGDKKRLYERITICRTGSHCNWSSPKQDAPLCQNQKSYLNRVWSVWLQHQLLAKLCHLCFLQFHNPCIRKVRTNPRLPRTAPSRTDPVLPDAQVFHRP